MEEKFVKTANRLLDGLWNDDIGISFAESKINNNEFTILPDSIAIGDVYKVSYEGSLDKEGYEKGFLFIPVGSGIKEHQHINDIEQYTLICGELKVNGEEMPINRCMIGCSHGIDPVSQNTAIKILKISKKLIEEKMNTKTY